MGEAAQSSDRRNALLVYDPVNGRFTVPPNGPTTKHRVETRRLVEGEEEKKKKRGRRKEQDIYGQRCRLA